VQDYMLVKLTRVSFLPGLLPGAATPEEQYYFSCNFQLQFQLKLCIFKYLSCNFSYSFS